MSAILAITRAGPLATIQDSGRFGMLSHGVSASGPMDRAAYAAAGRLLGPVPDGGIEITPAGIAFTVEQGACRLGLAGGDFVAERNGKRTDWPGVLTLAEGDRLSITPGASGNYGYLRFDGAFDLPPVLGSLSTNSRAQLGGFEGRALRPGDQLRLRAEKPGRNPPVTSLPAEGPIRVVWALHAELFTPLLRQRFAAGGFTISKRLDRMGVRLTDPDGVFAASTILSLVSDAIVPGDIQILGDGTPIVLMRDHQPTGGYPRLATIISADLDRFAQLRPGAKVAFRPVTVDHAHRLLRGLTS